MAHPQQIRFVSLARGHFFSADIPGRVLEIGSYDVNGSIRACMPAKDYVGVDLVSGPGVDVVRSGHELDFPDGSFDCVVSCECFEHNPYWKETFLNMHRMVSGDGVVIVTCASRGRLEHGTERTSDKSPGTKSVGWKYYKNLTENDFLQAFDLPLMFDRYGFFYIPVSQDLYFYGFKSVRAFESKFGKIDLLRFEKEVAAIRTMSNSSGRFMHFLNLIERTALSVFSLFGETVFQNMAVPYFKFRGRVYQTVKSLIRRQR